MNNHRFHRVAVLSLTVCRRIVLALVILLAVPAMVAVAQPGVPALTGRVVDEAGILSPSTEQTITTLLADHEARTSNQVAVLTIQSLNGETVEDYAIRVAETWGLGTAKNDNGVLLLVAVDDRELRIEVGLGLEGSLTDAVAGRIIRNDIVPKFREGDYEGGVLAGVQSILGVIEGTYTPSEAGADDFPFFLFGLMFLLIPSLFAAIGIFSAGGIRWVLFVFLIPFYAVGGFAITQSLKGGLIILATYAVIYIGSQFIPKVREIQKSNWNKSGSGGGSGWSSGGGGWSSGGGFSGGGGSFGGGGSSGSW